MSSAACALRSCRRRIQRLCQGVTWEAGWNYTRYRNMGQTRATPQLSDTDRCMWPPCAPSRYLYLNRAGNAQEAMSTDIDAEP